MKPMGPALRLLSIIVNFLANVLAAVQGETEAQRASANGVTTSDWFGFLFIAPVFPRIKVVENLRDHFRVACDS